MLPVAEKVFVLFCFSAHFLFGSIRKIAHLVFSTMGDVSGALGTEITCEIWAKAIDNQHFSSSLSLLSLGLQSWHVFRLLLFQYGRTLSESQLRRTRSKVLQYICLSYEQNINLCFLKPMELVSPAYPILFQLIHLTHYIMQYFKY